MKVDERLTSARWNLKRYLLRLGRRVNKIWGAHSGISFAGWERMIDEKRVEEAGAWEGVKLFRNPPFW